jgi:uncharacterized membrane protein (DUF373 family)
VKHDDIEAQLDDGEKDEQIASPFKYKVDSAVTSLKLLYMGQVQSTAFKDEPKIRTRMSNQHKFNSLYRGVQVKSHFIYAYLINQFICCFMFSSGIPIMYFVGFCFCIVQFFVYKILLLSFYEKTFTFSLELVKLSTNFMFIGIFLHLFMGCIFYTDSKSMKIKKFKQIENNMIEFIRAYFTFFRDREISNNAFLFGAVASIVFTILIIGSVLYILTHAYFFSQRYTKVDKVDSSGVDAVSNFYQDLTLVELAKHNLRFRIERQEAFDYVKSYLQNAGTSHYKDVCQVRKQTLIEYL